MISNEYFDKIIYLVQSFHAIRKDVLLLVHHQFVCSLHLIYPHLPTLTYSFSQNIQIFVQAFPHFCDYLFSIWNVQLSYFLFILIIIISPMWRLEIPVVHISSMEMINPSHQAITSVEM